MAEQVQLLRICQGALFHDPSHKHLHVPDQIPEIRDMYNRRILRAPNRSAMLPLLQLPYMITAFHEIVDRLAELIDPFRESVQQNDRPSAFIRSVLPVIQLSVSFMRTVLRLLVCTFQDYRR